MSLLGWVPGPPLLTAAPAAGADAAAAAAAAAAEAKRAREQPRFTHNASGRFESRFVTVAVAPDSPAVMLAGMGGARLGVWVAHGEGRAYFPGGEPQLRAAVGAGLAPLRYVDDAGAATEAYPANPNGSPLGIAALCSPDGRHLAMMPHPERCFLPWQLPWLPRELRRGGAHELPATAAPWLRLFQNAREWCERVPGAGAAAL
jgi:phosphoribosylformylglycinamidine synthase